MSSLSALLSANATPGNSTQNPSEPHDSFAGATGCDILDIVVRPKSTTRTSTHPLRSAVGALFAIACCGVPSTQAKWLSVWSPTTPYHHYPFLNERHGPSERPTTSAGVVTTHRLRLLPHNPPPPVPSTETPTTPTQLTMGRTLPADAKHQARRLDSNVHRHSEHLPEPPHTKNHPHKQKCGASAQDYQAERGPRENWECSGGTGEGADPKFHTQAPTGRRALSIPITAFFTPEQALPADIPPRGRETRAQPHTTHSCTTADPKEDEHGEGNTLKVTPQFEADTPGSTSARTGHGSTCTTVTTALHTPRDHSGGPRTPDAAESKKRKSQAATAAKQKKKAAEAEASPNWSADQPAPLVLNHIAYHYPYE